MSEGAAYVLLAISSLLPSAAILAFICTLTDYREPNGLNMFGL